MTEEQKDFNNGPQQYFFNYDTEGNTTITPLFNNEELLKECIFLLKEIITILKSKQKRGKK